MSTNTNTAAPALVDVRGPRFAAWVTTVVIVATLIAAAIQLDRSGRDPGRPGRCLRDRRMARARVSIPTA